MSWPIELRYSLYPDKDACERCQGSGEIITDWEAYLGDAEGDGVEECPDCDGTGRTHGEGER